MFWYTMKLLVLLLWCPFEKSNKIVPSPLSHSPYLGDMLILNNWESPLAYYFPLPGSDGMFITFPYSCDHTHISYDDLYIYIYIYCWELCWTSWPEIATNMAQNTSFHFENHFVDISVFHFGSVRGFLHFGNHEIFIVGLPFRLPCSSFWILSPKVSTIWSCSRAFHSPRGCAPLVAG